MEELDHGQSSSIRCSSMSEKIVVTILGIAQDGGVPHPGCLCDTCKRFSEEGRHLSPTSLAVRDGDELHLIDVTRDLDRQTRMLDAGARMITDVWITHGHLGHVDGLGLFGREVMASRGIRLHASESMFHLIHETPLWNALLDQGVFIKKQFDSGHEIQVSKNLSLVPIKVPHRDEWSDTHAFLLRGPIARCSTCRITTTGPTPWNRSDTIPSENGFRR